MSETITVITMFTIFGLAFYYMPNIVKLPVNQNISPFTFIINLVFWGIFYGIFCQVYYQPEYLDKILYGLGLGFSLMVYIGWYFSFYVKVI